MKITHAIAMLFSFLSLSVFASQSLQLEKASGGKDGKLLIQQLPNETNVRSRYFTVTLPKNWGVNATDYSKPAEDKMDGAVIRRKLSEIVTTPDKNILDAETYVGLNVYAPNDQGASVTFKSLKNKKDAKITETIWHGRKWVLVEYHAVNFKGAEVINWMASTSTKTGDNSFLILAAAPAGEADRFRPVFQKTMESVRVWTATSR